MSSACGNMQLMDISSRLAETEQKFESKKSEREEHLRRGEECLAEMTKLQGEYRLLKEMLEETDKPAKEEKK